MNSDFVATNAYLADQLHARPAAGRRCDGNVTLQRSSPTRSTWIAGTSSICALAGFRLRNGSRSVISMDLFNALNSDAVVGVNQAFATYLVPTEILNARVAKFTINFDF